MVQAPTTSSHAARCRPGISGMAVAGEDPPRRAGGETDMVPQRVRWDHRLRSTLSGAIGSTNDSGMSDTSGGMERCLGGVSRGHRMRRPVWRRRRSRRAVTQVRRREARLLHPRGGCAEAGGPPRPPRRSGPGSGWPWFHSADSRAWCRPYRSQTRSDGHSTCGRPRGYC